MQTLDDDSVISIHMDTTVTQYDDIIAFFDKVVICVLL